MDLAAIMKELAEVLDQHTGLRVHDHPPATVVPPAGIVGYPDSIDYDQTYGRGMDRIPQLPVWLLTGGKPTDAAARNKVAGWAAGSGDSSIKILLEAHTWASCDVVVVRSAEFGVQTIAGVDYLAVEFSLDIAGNGTN